jgi:rare lipoprotein A (peptidoglycan hydrolase)
MDSTAFHAGSTGSNPVRGTTDHSVESTDSTPRTTTADAHNLPTPRTEHPRDAAADTLSTSIIIVALATLALSIAASLLHPREAEAAWRPATATWYGPSFYGNAFACSHLSTVPNRYSRNVRGAAHMTLPCGTRIRVCRRSRCVTIRVIDRGAFHHANLDLTARTAMDLCACWQPYTMQIKWRRA